MTTIQSALVVAVHRQPPGAVTPTDPVEPLAPNDAPGADSVTSQGAASGCETVTVWPPIVTVPVRAAPGFAATASVTVPAPAPVGADAIAIHAVWLAAFHEHAETVSTEIVAVPPDADTVAFVGVTA